MKKICETCKKTFDAAPSKTGRFCSRQCSSIWKSEAYKGRKLTPEWLKNQSESKRRDNVVKYGDYSCPRCGGKFETNLSLRSHTSYCHGTDAGDFKCDQCEKSFKWRRSLTNHCTLHHDLERNALHRGNTSKGCVDRLNQKTSKEEVAFGDALRAIYGADDVVHKFKIEGLNHEYDYYVQSINTIVEYDGDYWHGNTERYVLNDWQKRQYHIDRSCTKAAEKCGFTVQRVWSSKASSYPNELREFKKD